MSAHSDMHRVLVVDDEPQVLTSLQDLLEDDFIVRISGDPKVALELLQEEEFEVILSDQRMPHMGGDQFLSQAQKFSHAVRILITGYADMEALVRAVNEGKIYAYITKPWDPYELRLAVSRAAEQYHLRQALEESEARLAGLVEHLPQGTCLLDAHARVRLLNPAARQCLEVLGEVEVGQSLTSLGGRPLEELRRPPPGELSYHEFAIGSPPARIFTAELRPISREGHANEWILLLREVTQERKVQEQVQQQNRLAAVGQMAAGIAHDFNNLLTIMTGIPQILARRAGVPEEVKEELRSIVTSGERAAQMVRQLLDFSRTGATEWQPANLESFLKEGAKLLRRILPENIRLQVEIEAGRLMVEANLTQLQQVLINLALNSQDAMPGGGELRIGLTALRVEPGGAQPLPGVGPGVWIVWSVADTGVGIPPENLKHIFEPFFTTKPVGKGTGLGLAQVYGFVKQHKGEIAVESQVGKGTIFTLYLPQIVGKKQVQKAAQILRGQGQTVLVVEDEEGVRKVFEAMLGSLNYRVLVAAEGGEALALYTQHRGRISLVLTDWIMPGMDGEHLIQTLRQRDPGVRVVIVSGYLPAKGALPQGVLGVIHKPLDLEQIAQVVHQALEQGRLVEGPR